MAKSISQQLVDSCLRPVSTEQHERAILHIVDWLACAAIGSSVSSARALWYATELPNCFDKPSFNNDPWRHLLYEASLGNLFEMDDVHRTALVHPGSVVVPSTLFIARRLGANGGAILTAVVRGYEAMIRFGMAVGTSHYDLHHNTATCGVLGAAAAACSLLQLNKSDWVNAFGHAVTQAAGLWQVRLESCMSKQWHLARTAQTGVQAALYARAGLSGPEQIFEGTKGYFAANCPDGDLNKMVENSSIDWQINVTSFKPWPACRHAHAAIDAAILVRKQILEKYDDLEKWGTLKAILVRSYADALAFCDNSQPNSSLGARFSLQHAVAIALLTGNATLEDFEVLSINNPVVQTIRKKIQLVEDSRYSALYPAHFGAGVQVDFLDGSVFKDAVQDAWGDPEWPMLDQDIYDKARNLMHAAGWSNAYIEGELSACGKLLSAPKSACQLNFIQ